MDGIATREGRRAVPYGLALRDQAAGDVLAMAPVCRDEREHVVRARLEWRFLIEPRLVVPVIGVELGEAPLCADLDVGAPGAPEVDVERRGGERKVGHANL